MKVNFGAMTMDENEKNRFDPARQLARVFTLLTDIYHAQVVISGKVAKLGVDLICCGIQLGFGRIKDGMFASKSIGMEGMTEHNSSRTIEAAFF